MLICPFVLFVPLGMFLLKLKPLLSVLVGKDLVLEWERGVRVGWSSFTTASLYFIFPLPLFFFK